MSISRNTFDASKHYDKVSFHRDRQLVDSELNELQDIIRANSRAVVAQAIGDGSPDEGFKIVGYGAANNFTIKAGTLFVKGRICVKEVDEAYTGQTDYVGAPALVTPAGNRTDKVYLHIFEENIDSAGDPNIKDPTLNVETANRTRLRFRVKVAEGGNVPANDASNTYYQLATLFRYNGINIIQAVDITDNRAVVQRGAADHGTLAGLLDDDHTQYHNDARGDARYTPLAHAGNTANPHSVTKAQVGLGNVDNTADANKSVLYALTAGTAAASDVYAWAKAATKPSYTAAEVGLGNVTNEAQIAKAIGDAKGDLITFSAADAPIRLPAGADGQVLKANAAAAGGLEWGTAAAGGVTDHGALTGLADDDHTQYLNNARGDARYVPLASAHKVVSPGAGETSGLHVDGVAGETLAFGDFCYMKDDGRWWKASNAAAASTPALCMSKGSYAGGASGQFLKAGYAASNAWSFYAEKGRPIYLGAAGAFTVTKPTTVGQQVQILGYVSDYYLIYVNPNAMVVGL